MYYFTLQGEALALHTAQQLPAEIEALYQTVRQKYTIDYQLSDWADDDGDSGMGYCYDNSYKMKREPSRNELVLRDGALVGFYVGRILPIWLREGFVVPPENVKKYFLSLPDIQKLYDDRQPYSKRYSSSECWEVLAEPNPHVCEYAFLTYVEQADRSHTFTAADFSEELVENVVKQIYIEDSRGHFDGAYRVKVKLKPDAVKEPDRVLAELSRYRAFLVRE